MATTKDAPAQETPEAEPQEEESPAETEARESARRALRKIVPDSPDLRTIHQRMVAILDELPAIGKERENTQQHFMFRGHDDILNALNPLLAKHGIIIVPNVLDRVATIRSTGQGKAMYEVNLHVEFTFWGATGDFVTASTWGEGTDMGDKATNKAMTMAFKNVLNQAFSISTQEMSYADADAETPEETVTGRADPEAAKKQTRRRRIGQVLAGLDEKSSSEKGTWGKLVEQEVQRVFGVSYADLGVEELEDVGKTLRLHLDGESTDVPEQLQFVVPF